MGPDLQHVGYLHVLWSTLELLFKCQLYPAADSSLLVGLCGYFVQWDEAEWRRKSLDAV